MKYTHIVHNELKSLPTASYQLIDVREESEVLRGKLPHAKNIPLNQLPQRLAELDKNRTVVVICQSGQRSARAADFLVQAGFAKVANVTGGMAALHS